MTVHSHLGGDPSVESPRIHPEAVLDPTETPTPVTVSDSVRCSMFRRNEANGRLSPRSASDECNEDTNPFYCLPSADRTPTASSSSSAAWWDDVQAWHAALWRAAVLRSAFNGATNGVHHTISDSDSKQSQPSRQRNESRSISQVATPRQSSSTLLIFPVQDSGDLASTQQSNAFVCTLPAKLVSGQRIRVSVDEATYDLTVNATRAVICQTPVSQPNRSTTYAPPYQERDSSPPCGEDDGDRKKPIVANQLLCSDSENGSNIFESPTAVEATTAVRLQSQFVSPAGSYRTYLNSHRSWPPAAPQADGHRGGSTAVARSFQQALYNHRKRARSAQGSNHARHNRKREISIARVASPVEEDGRSVADRDSGGEGTTVAGFDRKSAPSTVDGVNLEEIKRFAKQFKMKRLSLGLTQTQVGQTLSLTNGPAYSQSAICRFEKLDITPKSAQKIKPVLERWLHEVDEQIKVNGGIINVQRSLLASPSNHGSRPEPPPPPPPSKPILGAVEPSATAPIASLPPLPLPQPPSQLLDEHHHRPSLTTPDSPDPPPDKSGSPQENDEEPTEGHVLPVACLQHNCPDNASGNCKRRKRRTSFTPQALEVLNEYFERNSHPSGLEMTTLAERLNYEREVIRVWFCNKRQALKNTFKKLKTSHLP